MATTGSFTKSIYSGHYKLKVNWSQSKNIADNTSSLTLKAYFINDIALSIKATDNDFIVDGTSYSFSSSAISSTGTHLLGSKTITVAHDNQGKKTVSVNALFNAKITAGGTTYNNLVASANITLDSIPRASSVKADSCDIGSETTITITSALSTFTHSLTYTFNGATGQILMDKNTDTTVKWTPPMYMCSDIPDSTNGVCLITCSTYYNGSIIGSKQTSLTLRVPESVKPTIGDFTAECVDEMAWGIYVQSKSQAKLNIKNAKGSYGSTVKSYSITGGGYSSSESSLTTGYLNSSGNIIFKAKVTDSRGRVSDEKKITINVVPYSAPTISGYTSQRCTGDGSVSDEGTYIKSKVSFSSSSCNGYNSTSTAIEYRKSGDDNWTDTGKEIPNDSDIVFGDGSISTEFSYEVRYTISDYFTSVSITDLVSTSEVVMDFKYGGKGVAIGKVSETDNCFEVSDKWSVKFFGKQFIDCIYPVGSIYMTTGNDNPTDLFGGVWEELQNSLPYTTWRRKE